MSQSFRAADRLAALRAYLEPLAARRLLALAERAGPDEAWLQVTPANDQAAPMHIYLDRRSGYIALHAGRSFAVDDHYWD
ncbi:MAG TPA: hypothetical protein VGE07_12790 [Herpetosiphonaceae bacterium]